MVLVRVPAIVITKGAPLSVQYVWGTASLAAWTGVARFRRRGVALATVTPTLGSAGAVTIALTAAQTTSFPDVGPAHRPSPCGSWDLSLTDSDGVIYRPFGGPVLLINGVETQFPGDYEC